ncbi:MAG: hypothetical protein JRI35_00215 [Deltaproteobacteria bacterium]|nr:hypothetical protein [Deltaproteobacteria bacterium]
MKRLPFSGFQSSLIADRRGSAILARYPKPCKRQTAPAARHGWQPIQRPTGSPNIYIEGNVGESLKGCY